MKIVTPPTSADLARVSLDEAITTIMRECPHIPPPAMVVICGMHHRKTMRDKMRPGDPSYVIVPGEVLASAWSWCLVGRDEIAVVNIMPD